MGRAGLKTRCVRARCYFEGTEINCTTDQLEPGLKSMAQYFLLFKERVSNMRLWAGPQRMYTLLQTVVMLGKQHDMQWMSVCVIVSGLYLWFLLDYFHFSGVFQAARNCLVNSSLVVKVSDFGMTRYRNVFFIIHV